MILKITVEYLVDGLCDEGDIDLNVPPEYVMEALDLKGSELHTEALGSTITSITRAGDAPS